MDPDELRRLLDQIIAAMQPGWLDWLTGLAVPLILGGATVAVAVLAVRATNRSTAAMDRNTEMIRELERDRLERDKREKRLEVSAELTALLIAEIVSDAGAPDLIDKRSAINKHAKRLGDPALSALASWMHRQVADWKYKTGPASEVLSKVLPEIDAWVENPTDTGERLGRRDALQRAVDEAK